jgi:quinol monooxygenase YgiN
LIIAIKKFNVLPEKRQEFLQTFHGFVKITRQKEGCASCRLYKDLEDRNAFGLVEEWQTPESLENHLQSDDAAVVTAITNFLSEPAEIKYTRLGCLQLSETAEKKWDKEKEIKH